MSSPSHRGIDLKESAIRGLVPYARNAVKEGKSILYLNIGQPDLPTPFEALESVRHDNSNVIKYGPSEGLVDLRHRLCVYYEKYNAHLNIEDVLVTTGASEAILFALFATCDVGDEIIIPEPFYANYIGFAHVCGVTIVPITTTIESEFALPQPSEFLEKISPKTKAIFLCNPGNPTGQLYNKKQLESLSTLVIEYNLFLIVDEVYKEFCYDEKFTSVLSFQKLDRNVIVIDSISKVFSSCGARIGFLISKNKKVIQAVIRHAQLRLCPPYFGQKLAITCFDKGESYIEHAKKAYEKRRALLHDGLKNIDGIKTYLPAAAFYNMIELPVDNAMDFCKWLLTDFHVDNQTVMLAPAEGFYKNSHLGKRQVRIAYVLNEQDLSNALTILNKGLKHYKENYSKIN